MSLKTYNIMAGLAGLLKKKVSITPEAVEEEAQRFLAGRCMSTIYINCNCKNVCT